MTTSDPLAEVVTVTVNPAVDQTVWIPGFRAGAVNRVVRDERSPGGKGVNVAAFLAAYGVPVVATGHLGCESAGAFETFLAERGVACHFVEVPGVVRTGVKIVDDEAGTTTDINFPGFPVDVGHCRQLEDRLADLVPSDGWTVLAGSLPPGAPVDTYRRLVELVHGIGGRVAVDTSGPALAEAVAAGPDLVKPNAAELAELVGREPADRRELVAAADELVAGGVGTVAVSLGDEGALFVRDGAAVRAAPPPVQVASTVGAGDAMVAGSVAAALGGASLTDTAALATAFSVVAISRVGPHLDAAAVRAQVGVVEVEELR